MLSAVSGRRARPATPFADQARTVGPSGLHQLVTSAVGKGDVTGWRRVAGGASARLGGLRKPLAAGARAGR